MAEQTGKGWPGMAWIEQELAGEALEDIGLAVESEIRSLGLEGRVRPGERVALAAGSRGIRNLPLILEHVLRSLRGQGLEPFVVPAMGSHGGATAEGQQAVLASLGVTEERLGAPIRAGMDTVSLGRTAQGIPVQVDAQAMAAEHIVPVNRIKAHTKFKGRIESGLLKMLAFGLGNHEGASRLHRAAVRSSMETVLLEAGRRVLAEAPVLFGLGLVENGLGETFRLKALPPEGFEAEEAGLLREAKGLAPKIPAERVDLLIVDRLGKDISGTGMDTNVIGRNRDILGGWSMRPHAKRILVRDLSPGTQGNALGLGFADFCTERAVQAMDLKKTRLNAMTGLSPEKAAIPMHLATDREAVLAALRSLGDWEPNEVRVVRILDTLRLERLQVSEALLRELPASCRVLSQPRAMAFDERGWLLD